MVRDKTMINASNRPGIKKATNATPLSRRGFLGLGLGAAAAVPFLPSELGRAAEPSQGKAPQTFERKIKLGVVGCGGRGNWIAHLFRNHGGYEMWSVADYFESVANSSGDSLGVAKDRRFSGLTGYKKLLESGIEAVALETPPYFFPEHAGAAVEAGLHVYMAKPIAVDVPGCLTVEAAARKATGSKRVFLVDYQIPTDPHNVEVARIVHTGGIGKLLSLNSHYFAGQFADPPKTDTLESRLRSLIWCNDVAVGGGYHVNACIHAVDGALWLAGQRPVSAMGLSRIGRPNPHGDSHDVFQLLLEFENGVLLSHRGKHLDNLTGFDVVCLAHGEAGYAQIGYGGHALVKSPENIYDGEVQNLYEAGAVRNIAKFYELVVRENYANDTVSRAVDGALATILGREAGLRRNKLTMAQVLKENRRLEVDLRGLRA